MNFKHILTFLLTLGTLLVTNIHTWAQEAAPKVEMATNFYGEGKIYIVIAVLLIIFIGIILYLVRLEKKINKLEKEIK